MDDIVYYDRDKLLELLETFIYLNRARTIEFYLKKSSYLVENYSNLCKLLMVERLSLDEIRTKYEELKVSKGYLLVIGEAGPNKIAKEARFQLSDYRLACLEQCYWIMIDSFDQLPIDEFPEDYGDFERVFIKEYMDCSPIQYRLYSLENCETVRLDMHRAYQLFLEKLEANNIKD